MKKKIKVSKPGKHRPQWMIIPDIHFPEHDPEALEVMKAALNTLQPENVILLGDILDCEIFSGHAKRTIPTDTALSFGELEIDPCNKLLDEVQENTSNHTYFLEGNHEQRIERWAANNGKVGESIYSLISPKKLLTKGRNNFTFIPYVYKQPTGEIKGFVQLVKQSKKMKTGGLVAVHGWSYAKHASSIHLEKSRSQSIVYGHCHRMQSTTSRDPWTGALIKSFCPGTLSKLQPIYAHGGAPSDWTHGFGVVFVGTESWTEYTISIVKGSCVLPDGREIKLI